jgi:F-type H+-transporting ATPase subunit b
LAGLLLAVGWPCAAARAAEDGGIYVGDWGQAIVSVLIFLGLLFVLGKWAWKPIIRQLRDREEQVADTVRRAENREAEARRLLEDYKARLQRAEADAEKLLAEARDEAAQAREEMLASARDEAQRTLRRAAEQIELAKQAAASELCETTVELATEMAGEIVGRTLDAGQHRDLVRESLKKIAAQASQRAEGPPGDAARRDRSPRGAAEDA